jgi:hypothetical protein
MKISETDSGESARSIRKDYNDNTKRRHVKSLEALFALPITDSSTREQQNETELIVSDDHIAISMPCASKARTHPHI